MLKMLKKIPDETLLTRYLRQQLFRYFAAGLAVLAALFAVNHLLRLLGRAALGQLPESFLPQLTLLLTFESLLAFLPLLFFGSILWLFYRLQVRRELQALCAMGVPPSRYSPAMVSYAAVLFLLVAMLSIWLSPLLKSYFFQQLQQARLQAQLSQVLTSGRFLLLPQEKLVLYAEKVEKNQLENVFLLVEGRFLELAAKAYQDPQNPTLLWLEDGRAYDLQAQHLLTFGRQSLPLPTTTASTNRPDTLPFFALWQAQADPKQMRRLQAEGHWRLAFPISIIFLTWFAFFLIQHLLRAAPLWTLLLGLIGYFFYANALSIGKVLLIDEKIPLAWGLWPVHLLVLLVLLGLLGLSWRSHARLVS
jgi:lipopolysaccharide export system permease protein